mmetsp:Transcript_35329/g.31772  ORF Transcript_35329/g.31772 Transcript_35329/m.31772 type:complete len:183 (-) Transcript_35329:1103-1651(-)
MNEIGASRLGAEKYYERRMNSIDSFFKDEKKAQETIDKMVEKLFDEQYQEEMQLRQKRSEEVHQFYKAKTFEKVQRIIHDSRLRIRQEDLDLIYKKETMEAASNNRHLVPIFFPENPAESYLDVKNPVVDRFHPYMKHVDNAKRKMKLKPNELTMYFEGLIDEEHILEFTETKDFDTEALIP